MIVSLIVAMDRSRGIGKENQIPWHLSDDLKRFKQLTMGHHLIMGRKTYESIGKNLPGRVTIVITRDLNYEVEGALVVHSLKEALNLASDRGENEAFIIGGGQIYELALDLADRIYLTQVQTQAQCDVFFPEFCPSFWNVTEIASHEADEKNEYPFTISNLERSLT